MPRPLYEIAADIQADWSKIGKGVNYAAKPYLDAMKHLQGMDDFYVLDDAKSIVLYFLGNASSYRGAKAKELKAELRGMVK